MTNGIKWYSLDKILKFTSQYYIIMGERSNGKTFAVQKMTIDNFFKSGKKDTFAYVRRFQEDIKTTHMNDVMIEELQEYMLEKYNHRVKFYRGQWLVYEDGTDGKITDCTTFGQAFSIANVNRTKGTSFPSITTIVFEEFMSIDCTYINDELNLFMNLVSTIVRYRTNVKVFMLSNTISKFSPYTSALKLKVHRQEKDSIVNKVFVDKKGFNTKFTIERTPNVNVFDNKDNKEKTVYNIFGDSGVGRMITTGDFETHAYPRRVDNITFAEIRKVKNDRVIGKKDITNFVLRFEDYFYRIYMYNGEKIILAFREVDEKTISSKNTGYIINGIDYKKGIVNINNLAFYDNENVNRFINIIVSCMRQKDFISFSDDDGENIVNGFRLSGITLKQ